MGDVFTSAGVSLQQAERERGPLAAPEKIDESAVNLAMKGGSHTAWRVERGVARTASTCSTAKTTSLLSCSSTFFRCCPGHCVRSAVAETVRRALLSRPRTLHACWHTLAPPPPLRRRASRKRAAAQVALF